MPILSIHHHRIIKSNKLENLSLPYHFIEKLIIYINPIILVYAVFYTVHIEKKIISSLMETASLY